MQNLAKNIAILYNKLIKFLEKDVSISWILQLIL